MPKPIAIAAFLTASAIAVAPMMQDHSGHRNWASMPEDPAAVESNLRSKPTLIAAIQAAEKATGGIAHSAKWTLHEGHDHLDVVVYADGRRMVVPVNPMTCEPFAPMASSRWPGNAITGDIQDAANGVKFIMGNAGEGERPTAETTVSFHATLYLNDGTKVFDTRERGAAPEFPLRSVSSSFVPGVQTALERMPVGSTMKCFIPPAEAFGPQGAPSINVPANALIVCDLERLERPDYEMVPDSLPGMDLGGVEKNITESGLVYYDMVEGDGPMPSGPSARVKVHYTGYLVNGDKFDSSVDRGTPAEFGLGQVIKGWTEGVGSMKVGGQRKLVIPYGLAYGENGRPGSIPARATLIFDVELLEVVDE